MLFVGMAAALLAIVRHARRDAYIRILPIPCILVILRLAYNAAGTADVRFTLLLVCVSLPWIGHAVLPAAGLFGTFYHFKPDAGFLLAPPLWQTYGCLLLGRGGWLYHAVSCWRAGISYLRYFATLRLQRTSAQT